MPAKRTNLGQLFCTKLYFNLKSESHRNRLGYLWWILEPSVHVAAFYFVFQVLLERGTEHFVVFLLCGNIPFLWFSKSVSNSVESITGGRGVISQVAIPKAFFPLLVVSQDAIKQIFVFGALFAFLIIYGFPPDSSWLYVPVVAGTQLSLIIAAAMVVAGIRPFFPDIKIIIGSTMTLLMFVSGVFYSYEHVIDPQYQRLFLLNPLASLIKNYRTVLIDGSAPDMQALFWIFCVSLVITMAMLMLFNRLDSKYARLVIQ
ncbi:MAG: ABC transporter permease [Pseudomonadales bacterium]|jgi:lipopolysaccharide transport system permease protein|nr:ABC transporter permease [Pseudomonadales bacterium]MDP6470811.1 ABC transporter permease [Pseudomonadales bacterium]MDP6826004.1 ABC transporter permease [Pseudomonadales bacterium]MDP6972316.1 ABC transporter permease [Pseudomonadales bacterium]|tara:strand:+ start:1722 stop:2498 length:777 start_codon:yes stop_codon:yes gene_type:complete